MSMFIGEDTSDKGKAGELCAILTQDILAGRRPAGMHIREEELTAEGVRSRTPVREALIRLDALGLLSHRRNHGATVLPQAGLAELVDAYVLVHGHCVALAAEAMAEGPRARLSAWLKGLPVQANWEVASLILAQTGNLFLSQLSRLTLDRLLTTAQVLGRDAAALAAVLVPGAAVVAAVVEGRADGARAAMAEQIRAGTAGI
ncbi:MAG: GntR family transcriptional regulator [Actinomycetota bacterium]